MAIYFDSEKEWERMVALRAEQGLPPYAENREALQKIARLLKTAQTEEATRTRIAS